VRPRPFRPASDPGAPAVEGRRAAVCLAPVVRLLDRTALLVEAHDRRAGERDLLAVLGHDRPPLDRGSVARDDRVAHPDVRLALLLRERPAGVLDRVARLAERVRTVRGVSGVDRLEQVGVESAPRTRPCIALGVCRGLRVHLPNINRVLTAGYDTTTRTRPSIRNPLPGT